jgi:hypothetical protein
MKHAQSINLCGGKGMHANPRPTVCGSLALQGWQSCVDGVKELMEGEGGNHAVVEQCAEVVSQVGGGQTGV